MTKGPEWMPLNVGHYLRDTGHLTVTEHGAYMLLIMRYWQDGGLPADENLIRRYSLLSAEQWSESRPVLVALFDEGWKHKRIDSELVKAVELIAKRSANAQRQHSRGSAFAPHEQGSSSDTRVPPSPLPVIEPPASVPEPARALFDQIWEAFPRNPSSSKTKAEAAFDALKGRQQATLLDAAQRYRRWFTEDCKARDRTEDAGLKFVPHLATWITTGAWLEADSLPVKGESGPVVPMTRLDRFKDERLFVECERIGRDGKRAPMDQWAFRDEIVAQARANLEQSAAA